MIFSRTFRKVKLFTFITVVCGVLMAKSSMAWWSVDLGPNGQTEYRVADSNSKAVESPPSASLENMATEVGVDLANQLLDTGVGILHEIGRYLAKFFFTNSARFALMKRKKRDIPDSPIIHPHRSKRSSFLDSIKSSFRDLSRRKIFSNGLPTFKRSSPLTNIARTTSSEESPGMKLVQTLIRGYVDDILTTQSLKLVSRIHAAIGKPTTERPKFLQTIVREKVDGSKVVIKTFHPHEPRSTHNFLKISGPLRTTLSWAVWHTTPNPKQDLAPENGQPFRRDKFPNYSKPTRRKQLRRQTATSHPLAPNSLNVILSLVKYALG